MVFIISALRSKAVQRELEKEVYYLYLILLCSQPPAVSPEYCPWEDQAAVDSTTTLLHTHDTRDASRMEGTILLADWSIKRLELYEQCAFSVLTVLMTFTLHFSMADVTYSFDQVVKTNSPESCLTYLMDLEKRGNPHTDINLLNKLKDCYSKIFSRLPIRQFSKNASYARILVRYAELKGWVWRKILYLHYNLGTLWCVYLDVAGNWLRSWSFSQHYLYQRVNIFSEKMHRNPLNQMIFQCITGSSAYHFYYIFKSSNCHSVMTLWIMSMGILSHYNFMERSQTT